MTPCECEKTLFACANQVDLKDSCDKRFKTEHDAYDLCIEEQNESLPQVNFAGPVFLAFYFTIPLLTVLVLIYSARNQRFAPVSGSKDTLSLSIGNDVDIDGSQSSKGSSTRSMGALKRSMQFEHTPFEMEAMSQTGYTTNIVGLALYCLYVVVHLIIHFLLFALTVEYYVQQEANAISIFGSQKFFDDVQILTAFIVVWVVGFLWSFLMKFPGSMYNLVLRRCRPIDAQYIAVTASNITFEVGESGGVPIISCVGKFCFSLLSILFSSKALEGEGSNSSVTFCKVRLDKTTETRYFYFRFRRFIFDTSLNKFVAGDWDVTENTTIGKWLDKAYLHQGISNDEAVVRRGIVGPNVLDLKKPTLVGSILAEFSKTFYTYQTFLVWTWGKYSTLLTRMILASLYAHTLFNPAPFWYYYMAMLNTIIRLSGGLTVAYFTYQSDKDLYQLMVTEGTAEVLRGGKFTTVNQTEVVPGDIVRLVPGDVYFDMAILQAKKVIVDESALTGEVHPIVKSPLDPANADIAYDAKKHNSSTLVAGSIISECGDGLGVESDLAIVTNTGSFTAKGELLSDVLSYERHKFKFDDEVKIVLAILCVEAVILMGTVLGLLGEQPAYGFFYAMYVVGTVLPPLLPTVFVVSVGISNKRLQKKRITCTESQGILIAGKVKKAFFDKTGTLTKQGMEFLPSSGEGDPLLLNRGIACCHTIFLSKSGNLIGPTVDRIGFDAVGAKLIDEDTVDFERSSIKYLKRFEFDFFRMTQSVIVKNGDETIVYVKGSPESISKLCVSSSLPADYFNVARQSARDGIYQIVIATKAYTSDKGMHEVTRDDIETNLEFLGFINFQNPLKPDSPGVIAELRNGNVDCIMVTGDNVLTGVKIALDAGILEKDRSVIIGDSISDDGQIEWLNYSDDSPGEPSDEMNMALTGKVWSYLLEHDPKLALEYAKRSKVFGRCKPDEKVSVVTTFVEMGEISLFCGDGGNDCGALKAAHIGIALSDAEASVVAPFTSLDKEISSVTVVLREGRCALESALACYKYMLMYGQVSAINQTINAYFQITFSEWCWVFIDGIWVASMSFSLALAKAAKILGKLRPTASLLGPNTMWSYCGTLAINFLFLVIGLASLFAQPWFQCRKWDSTDVSNTNTIGDNYETSVIFIITGYQYISSAAAFNFGYSFRQNWFKNYVFVFLFVFFTALQFSMVLTSGKFSCIWRVNCTNENIVHGIVTWDPKLPITNNFSTTVMPISFRWLLFVLIVVNTIAICVWNFYIVNRVHKKRIDIVDTTK